MCFKTNDVVLSSHKKYIENTVVLDQRLEQASHAAMPLCLTSLFVLFKDAYYTIYWYKTI